MVTRSGLAAEKALIAISLSFQRNHDASSSSRLLKELHSMVGTHLFFIILVYSTYITDIYMYLTLFGLSSVDVLRWMDPRRHGHSPRPSIPARLKIGSMVRILSSQTKSQPPNIRKIGLHAPDPCPLCYSKTVNSYIGMIM